jgi:hypothetical protein
MISKKIFKLPFPFTDLSGQKSRPALAITEPDQLGDIEFLFITTKNALVQPGKRHIIDTKAIKLITENFVAEYDGEVLY